MLTARFISAPPYPHGSGASMHVLVVLCVAIPTQVNEAVELGLRGAWT